MLSVLTLGLIFIEEIEPCQLEIQKFKIRTTFMLHYVLAAFGDFSC